MSERRVREELLEPLRRSLAWLTKLCDSRGAIVCPEHRIEHTGKSAGAAVVAARLARYDDPGRREGHLRAALEQGRRLVANLHREGTSECHTFWPGRHDKFNSSNAIIDGGACSAALAELVEEFGGELSTEDRAAFVHASTLHARTYLRYAVLDKGVPAQRAWGLTGLAAAWRLSREPELERAAIEAIGALEGVQNADGSFPYHPLDWGAPHAGAGDTSSFYHSRIPAFTLFALDRLERDPRDRLFAGAIYGALDFAEALQGPDGIKCGLVEAKPWYWGAEYEVASHPFDVFAFARAGEVFGEPRFHRAAVRAYRSWIAHLGADGQPHSHLPALGRGKSYQCPVFWACHAEWIARALPQLEAHWDSAPLHELRGSNAGNRLAYSRLRSSGSGAVGGRRDRRLGARLAAGLQRSPRESARRRSAARGSQERWGESARASQAGSGSGGRMERAGRWFRVGPRLGRGA